MLLQKCIAFSRKRFYQYGNKPSHLLAYQLNCERAERSIKAIKTTEGVISYDLVKFNCSFKDFYEKQCTSLCASQDPTLSGMPPVAAPEFLVLVRGVEAGGMEHCISLYADDFLYLRQPQSSIPWVLDIIHQYSQYSAYKSGEIPSHVFKCLTKC